MGGPFTRAQLVESLGGGAIVNGPTDAIMAGRRDATLEIVMANDSVVSGFRLVRGVVYELAINAVLDSSPVISQIELWALFKE